MLSLLGGVMRGEHDDREIFIDQRIRSVLHLARGIAFRVDVGNFLQLQRAFERDGEMNAAAEIEKIVGAEKLAGEVFVLPVVGQNGFELAGNAHQFMHESAGAILVPDARGFRRDRGREWPAP